MVLNRQKTSSLLAASIALSLTSLASADFLGLYWEQHADWSYEGTEGTDYDVYRVYAMFSGEGSIAYWGGAPGEPFIVSTLYGTSFFQADNQTTALPTSAGFAYDSDPIAADHSTYMTIGAMPGYEADEVGEVFQLTPGFSTPLDVPSFGGEGGVLTVPGGPNSISVDGRVLLMQLTVESGEYISAWDIIIIGQADGENFQAITGIFTPAPGALALLGLAGLVGSRRRRA